MGSNCPAGAPVGWPVIAVAAELTVQLPWPITPRKKVRGVLLTSTLTPRAFWPLTAPGGAASVAPTGPRSAKVAPVRGPTYRAVHVQSVALVQPFSVIRLATVVYTLSLPVNACDLT